MVQMLVTLLESDCLLQYQLGLGLETELVCSTWSAIARVFQYSAWWENERATWLASWRALLYLVLLVIARVPQWHTAADPPTFALQKSRPMLPNLVPIYFLMEHLDKSPTWSS